MQKNLPPRPNLDHLRRQSKALLAALGARDPEAAKTIVEHLPAAKKWKPADVFAANLRLADAQSVIARQSGFATWPNLARHVEQLRALEGTWSFARLEVDGQNIPPAGLHASRLLIDGDRFRTESPEAIYEGVFNIDVEANPHGIDIEFVEGPEAGNWNYGIFRLAGDQLEICLDMNGKPRPLKFATTPGSGRAYETLKRVDIARPENVKGGTPQPQNAPPAVDDPAGFEYVESPLLAKLQGDWSAVRIVSNGQELPANMVKYGLRKATKNEVIVSFGGRNMIHALVRLDESTNPASVDYYNLEGPIKGAIQRGLFKWDGADACFCMAGIGQPRPTDFTSPPAADRTFSQWRRKN